MSLQKIVPLILAIVCCFTAPSISSLAVPEHSPSFAPRTVQDVNYYESNGVQSQRTLHRIIPAMQENLKYYMNRFFVAPGPEPENKQASVGFTNLLNMFPFLRRTSFYNEPSIEKRPYLMNILPAILQNFALRGTPTEKM